MKKFLYEKWFYILSGGIILFIILLLSRVEDRKVGATIIEHNVTADKYGTRTYSTILRTDDGYVEEKTGLTTYVIPVGSRTTINVVRAKK